MTVSCSPWWWVPVAACAATSVIPAHIPFEPTVSPDTAATRCIPDVCGVFGSKCSALTTRTAWIHAVGPSSGCPVGFPLIGLLLFLFRGTPGRAGADAARRVEYFPKNQQAHARSVDDNRPRTHLSLIEAHGGRLWATPNEPHGAIFHVALPVGPSVLAGNIGPGAGRQ